MTTPNTQTDEAEGQMKPTDGLPSSAFWQQQISLAEKAHRQFFDQGKALEKRYRGERDATQKSFKRRRFAIVYSNTETMRSALYARQAKPDVRQRWTQRENTVARTVGDMMERALVYTIDTTSHDKAFRAGVKDLCLPGRGVVRLCYEPSMGYGEAGQEVIVDQTVYEEFVYYRDFLHSPGKSWAEVWWVAFRKLLTRDDMEQQGFINADRIPLDWSPDIGGKKDAEIPEDLRRAEVWEIWNKSKKQRIFLVKGHPVLCRAPDDDPYSLKDFWPMAEPIQAVVDNSDYVPCSLITEYEDQADDLDEITDRISKLTKALKRRGIYDSSVEVLKRLARANDNEFLPVPGDKYAMVAAGGGLKRAFDTEDLKPIADALLGLYQQRDMLIQAIYEITGISDIMRGASQASETATAQQLKANFGSARLKDMQQDVQRWIRDTLRIKAELIAEHFEPQVLMQMTGIELQSRAEWQAQQAQQAMQAAMMGQPYQPQEPDDDQVFLEDVMEMLRSDRMRSYSIDIETDSTVFEDAATEKADRTELLQAIAGFMTGWLPVVQAGGPPMAKLGMKMLEFGVRGYKAGRQLEEALDEASDAIEEAAKQPPPPPPPDPNVEGEKIKLEGIKMQAQADAQATQADMARTQMDGQLSFAKHQMDMQKMAAQAELDKQRMAKQGGKA